MVNDADAAKLSGLQLGRALVLELGSEDRARLVLRLLRLLKACGKGELRLNVMDGQVTTAQPCPVFKTDEQFTELTKGL